MTTIKAFTLAVSATLLAIPVASRDFGVHGTLFPVTEPSLLDTIRNRLTDMEATGELETLKSEMQDRTRSYVNRPRPVLGLRPAEIYQSYEVDLSITLDQDLADHQGRIFARAGTTINPLGYSTFNKRIVLIDGDDPDQVAFALSLGNELDTKMVLTSGDPLGLMRAHGRRFWFDQDAVITKRFFIERLPAVISRADPVMLVEEIPMGQGATHSAEGDRP